MNLTSAIRGDFSLPLHFHATPNCLLHFLATPNSLLKNAATKKTASHCEREEGQVQPEVGPKVASWRRVLERGRERGSAQQVTHTRTAPQGVCTGCVLQLLGWQRMPPVFIRLSVQGTYSLVALAGLQGTGGSCLWPLACRWGCGRCLAVQMCWVAGKCGHWWSSAGFLSPTGLQTPGLVTAAVPSQLLANVCKPVRVRLEAGTGGDLHTLWCGCFDCVGCDVNGQGMSSGGACLFVFWQPQWALQLQVFLNVQRRLINSNLSNYN